jgi:glutamate dehydrogenase
MENRDAEPLVRELTAGFAAALGEVVPRLLGAMPPAYFKDFDAETRKTHLRAIAALHASGLPLRIVLRSDDGNVLTFVEERDYPGLLATFASLVPTDKPLRAAKVHGIPGGLVLDTFVLGEAPRFDPAVAADREKLDALVASAADDGVAGERQAYARFLERATAEYLRAVSPTRALATWHRFRRVSGTDDATVDLEAEQDRVSSRVVITVGNATPRDLFFRVAQHFGSRGVDIRRAYLDVFEDPDNGFVTSLTYVVQAPGERAIDPDSALWRELRRELLRLKWVSELALELYREQRGAGLLRAEVVSGLVSLVHQVLTRENPFAFARDRIAAVAKRFSGLVYEVAGLLVERFDPSAPLADAAFHTRIRALDERIDRSAEAEDVRRILRTMTAAVASVLRTNVHLDARYGLALRLDPGLFARAELPEPPFGVFFVHGRGFDGFHVRFRDIARGGVRVVRPSGTEAYVHELDRLFDEVSSLAYAQQQKNKDIPEGGAKAVIVAAPDVSTPRVVKGFTDGLLDLLLGEGERRGRVVDRFGRPETIYLGPDENITPELIEWIVARAARRGLPLPNSFMSSKPGAGINHKEFGVTSEGVTVFLEVVLRAAGIDPRRQPFTVKLTGGPDGDVAGNELKILHREFGDNVRVVGVADGSGSAEDPDGLAMPELLRLVDAEAPIAAFDPRRLGPRGQVVPLSAPDGARLRNTLHNRVVADAFIPAGGRPKTIHGGNWADFLLPDGAPSAKVIVEGANIFVTPEARAKLGERGVWVVKDSSANKCGVICSSFEIAASMVLDTAQFLAVKPRFVAEVLEKLRALAAREAELLIREHRRTGRPLPELSVELSRVVNRAADAIAAGLDAPTREREVAMRRVVERHLPAVLVEQAGGAPWRTFPAAYVKATVASSLASEIVYREGLAYLAPLEGPALLDVAFRYLEARERTQALVAALSTADAPLDRALLGEIVAAAGSRVLVERGGA